jgi:hypothetical protein
MGMTAARAARTQWFAEEGVGYLKQQATRPQTLGYALSDSPAGLLAWVLEKLTEWTDGCPWADDEVLDWVSVYWFARAGPAASLHIYYERAHNTPARFAEYVQVPYGVSLFAQELQRPSMPYVHALHLFRARRPLRASRPFAPSALCSVHALLPVPALLLPRAPPLRALHPFRALYPFLALYPNLRLPPICTFHPICAFYPTWAFYLLSALHPNRTHRAHHARAGGSTRRTTSSSSASTRTGATLRRTSSRSRSSATCGRCSGGAGRRTGSLRGMRDTKVWAVGQVRIQHMSIFRT